MSGETDNINGAITPAPIGGDDLENQIYTGDQFLELVEGTSYNVRTDSDIATRIDAALETAKNTILVQGEGKALTAQQAKAVSLYHSPGQGASTGALNNEDKVVVVSNEALEDGLTAAQKSIVKSLLSATETMVEDLADKAVGAFKHYGKMAKEMQTDLTKYKQLLTSDPDYKTTETQYAYGAYSRFFQAAGKQIVDFHDFSKIFLNLSNSVNFALFSGAPLSESNSRVILRALKEIQSSKKALASDDLEYMADHIRDDSIDVWRNAVVDMTGVLKDTAKEFPPVVPKSLGSPGKTRGPIVSLFDNHFLCWTAPVDYEMIGIKTTDIRTDFFGAIVERDKTLDVRFEPGNAVMALPSNKELLAMVNEAITMLSDIQRYEEFSKRIKSISSETKSQLKALNAIVTSETNENGLTVKSYMPLVMAVFQSFAHPHVKLIWQAIRASIMLACIADTQLITNPAERKYAKVVEKTTDKVTLKLDVDLEPDQVAEKETGYFSGLLVKLKKQ